VGLSACRTLINSPKYQFSDGYYTAKISGKPARKMYIDTEENLIKVYPVKRTDNHPEVDTTTFTLISFQGSQEKGLQKTLYFRQSSFDIDMLSILFKYRPSVQNFPNQFNTNLNGGLYLGYRSDVYSLDIITDPLGKYSRHTNHYGFSFGGFMGLGATAMNPWVTNNHISSEYDGVIWTKGVAGIMGFNRFTVGMVFGLDHLLDGNKQYWIYQGRPWIGIALGLNLN
jgi:hypothetical protein